MRTALTSTLAAAALAAAAVTAVGTGASGTPGAARGSGGHALDGRTAVGLTVDGRLVQFRADRPSKVLGSARVRGLEGDTRLVGIDHRVQDGALYGVGEAGGVYRLDARSGRAHPVLRLSAPLQGGAFGVDFNPVANALRVVSDTGQNLRQSFAATDAGYPATVVDGPLAYTAGTTATGVAAAGYTNDDLDPATATTLFVVDTALDQVAVQAPANAGSLSPTGALGVDVGPHVGLDVVAEVRGGRTVANSALLVDRGRLYEVDLLTGRADRLGTVPGTRVVDVAVTLGGR
ncbi:DUF4394 domain-containing protein [Vallicoccus soli]|uniref:DUF4394 domain-containing protein n=1 Tax=Vallicoccus soli TaxID=2339232 RepID=A0A3A3Z112_9ACTN|nr:DUF4394 domain-containing protein [Vallicoccus soli]RJK96106.1 DUF4394 domain-containing protein [Vallicoccus soli]